MRFHNNFIVKINKLVQVNSRICREIQGAKKSQENTEKEKLMKRIKVDSFPHYVPWYIV